VNPPPEGELARGLKNVVLDTTETSFIDGEVGKLLYYGYNIHDLAEKSSFEEVTFLLLNGRLPNTAELAELDSDLKANRELPDPIIEVIARVKDGHAMDVLRTGISALSTFDPDVDAESREAQLRKGIRLTAQTPTVVAAHHRMTQGKDPVRPKGQLSHAANFLYMLHGTEPDEDATKAIDVDLILHAEHGANASAFAARVAASTGADFHSAVVAAIATLKGPAHGGAAEAVMKMLEEIGSYERVEEYIREKQAKGERIMGLGHRVYRVEDPRAGHMKERAIAIGQKVGHPEWYQILERIVEVTAPLRAKGISLNVDFYAGAVYYLLGIPEELFVSLFAMGRMPGWTAQIIEQWRNNILIRPLMRYTGPMDLPYVPLGQRG